jgi:hypothetical protein
MTNFTLFYAPCFEKYRGFTLPNQEFLTEK